MILLRRGFGQGGVSTQERALFYPYQDAPSSTGLTNMKRCLICRLSCLSPVTTLGNNSKLRRIRRYTLKQDVRERKGEEILNEVFWAFQRYQEMGVGPWRMDGE